MSRQQRRQMQREAAKGNPAGLAAVPGIYARVTITMSDTGNIRMESTADPLTTQEMLLSGLGGIIQGFRQAQAKAAKDPVEDRKREYAGPRQFDEEKGG